MIKHKLLDKPLLIVMAGVVLALLVNVIPGNTPIRVIALPLVLLLPGYALTSAIFPERKQGLPERVLFSLGGSLVTVTLTGFALNGMPSGLRTSSWSIALSSITVVATIIAFLRRRRRNTDSAEHIWRGRRISLRQGLLVSVAAVVIAGAAIMSVVGAEQQPFPGFTQLWILPGHGTNDQHLIHLGVNNKEASAMNYRLELTMNGTLVKVWAPVYLASNEQWENAFMLPQSGQSKHIKVEASLYQARAPTQIYRHVVLWLAL